MEQEWNRNRSLAFFPKSDWIQNRNTVFVGSLYKTGKAEMTGI